MAGSNSKMNAVVMHRSMWADMPGAPVATAFTLDGPFKEKRVGLGLALFNETNNIMQRTSFYGAYSYCLPFNNDSKITFGLALGGVSNKVDLSRVIARDLADPALMDQVQNHTALDANFGLTYAFKDFKFGVSVPQLLSSSFGHLRNDARVYYKFSRHYMATTQYTFYLNKEDDTYIMPLVLLRYMQGAPVQYDVNTMFNYKHLGWVALSYKNDYAVGFNFGWHVSPYISVGYATDYIINPLKSYAGFTHEMVLKFTLAKRKDETTRISEYATMPQPEYHDTIGVHTKKNFINHDDPHIKAIHHPDTTHNAPQNEHKDYIAKNPAKKDSVISHTSHPAGAKPYISALANKIIDDKGNPVESGYYVIVASYKNEHDTAEKKKFRKLGYKMIFNSTKEWHYIYLRKFSKLEEAVTERDNARKVFHHAWILRVH